MVRERRKRKRDRERREEEKERERWPTLTRREFALRPRKHLLTLVGVNLDLSTCV